MTTPKGNTSLLPRPPIVVVMGHVDHGKTTLIDYIRKTNVAAKEAGGITQSIGAYEIEHPSTTSTGSGQASSFDKAQDKSGQAPKKITFIDTPGHEAFTKMRSRGATTADLAILVVAADEGVKPQTAEAIKILAETKTPYVVAITKIDRPGADLDKIKNDLTTHGVLLEGYGGNISYQPLSAKSGEGVNDLLDLLLLTAELENFTYDPKIQTSGYVLEAKRDKNRGLEVSVIVKNGILKRGQKIKVGSIGGKVKILENFLGKTVNELTPSSPAMIIGFDDLPAIGEEFAAGDDVEVQASGNQASAARSTNLSNHSPFVTEEEKGITLILKAENSGSLEALTATIQALTTHKPLVVKSSSVGEIYDGDVQLAVSTGSIIVAFHVKVNSAAKRLAETHKVKILESDIIYKLIEALQKMAEDTTPPPEGELEVLAIFNQMEPEKQVIGGKVIEGIFKNKRAFEIVRGETVIGKGRITNLQQNKADADQVPAGKECGMMVNSETMVKTGDHLVVRTA
ncbi:MAG: translation initiation factor IF-2 [Patescibacteria group bacterium]